MRVIFAESCRNVCCHFVAYLTELSCDLLLQSVAGECEVEQHCSSGQAFDGPSQSNKLLSSARH